MLFLEFVFGRAGSGIAPLPKCNNEIVPLLVGREFLELRSFLRSNDPADISLSHFW